MSECAPIIEADDDGTPEDTCRNGSLACAGPAAFDLSSEFHVPICRDCARDARIGRQQTV